MTLTSKTEGQARKAGSLTKRPLRAASIALAALIGASTALAQSGNAPGNASGEVEATLTAYAVTIEENGAEQLAPAEEIKPGGIIEYDIDYRNATDDPLENFIVLGDVPDQTTYLSVTAVEGFKSELEVHVPGIGWSLEPVIRYVQDEAGVLVPMTVQPEEYDALRWRMPNALAPGEEISVSYRIRVNN